MDPMRTYDLLRQVGSRVGHNRDRPTRELDVPVRGTLHGRVLRTHVLRLVGDEIPYPA